MIQWLFSFLIIFTFGLSSTASAAKSCHSSVSKNGLFQRALKGEKVDSFDLLVEMERLHNRDKFIQPVEEAHMPVVQVKTDNIQVNFFGTPEQNQAITKLLNLTSKTLNWFHHPDNTSSAVPFLYKTIKSYLVGFYSASRSIFFRSNDGFFSIKTGTDHPRGSKSFYSEEDMNKIVMDNTVEMGKVRMQVVSQVDQSMKPPDILVLAKKVAVIETLPDLKIKGQFGFRPGGYMVRNLDFLKNQNAYYIPAFSLPTVGLAIAKKKGVEFSKFWNKHYAEALGRAKAQFLVKYGLIMTCPHAQNILIEVDLNFMPTGRIVIRDLDNTKPHFETLKTLLENLNQKGINLDKDVFKNTNHINSEPGVYLYWRNFSDRAISFSDIKGLNTFEIAKGWEKTHHQGFAKEVARLLGISVNEIGKTEAEFTRFFSSEYAQELILNYYQNNSKN